MGDEVSLDWETKFRALPSQIIPVDSGTIIRRGAIQIKIEGEEAINVINLIFKISERGATKEQITRQFRECDIPPVSSLIDFLASRNLLIPCDSNSSPPDGENALDVFYWHFDPFVT